MHMLVCLRVAVCASVVPDLGDPKKGMRREYGPSYEVVAGCFTYVVTK